MRVGNTPLGLVCCWGLVIKTRPGRKSNRPQIAKQNGRMEQRGAGHGLRWNLRSECTASGRRMFADSSAPLDGRAAVASLSQSSSVGQRRVARRADRLRREEAQQRALSHYALSREKRFRQQKTPERRCGQPPGRLTVKNRLRPKMGLSSRQERHILRFTALTVVGLGASRAPFISSDRKPPGWDHFVRSLVGRAYPTLAALGVPSWRLSSQPPTEESRNAFSAIELHRNEMLRPSPAHLPPGGEVPATVGKSYNESAARQPATGYGAKTDSSRGMGFGQSGRRTKATGPHLGWPSRWTAAKPAGLVCWRGRQGGSLRGPFSPGVSL